MNTDPGIIWIKIAVVYLLVGVSLGIYMGASGDHSLHPVHAHINLLGWATLTLIVAIRRHDDGSESHAPLGIRLAQVIHHGTDHRSQVCTALTNLGIAPPDIDAWDFAFVDGRLVEVPAPTG